MAINTIIAFMIAFMAQMANINKALLRTTEQNLTINKDSYSNFSLNIATTMNQ